MNRDKGNLLIGLLVLLPLGMACAATQASNPHTEGNDLHGTWRWLGAYPGRLSAVRGEAFTNDCSCTRELTIEPDGKYTFTERDSLHEKSKAGAYTTHVDPHPWLDFEKGLGYGDARDHRLFRFRGPDTLILRDADFGSTVQDGGADLFVRGRDESRETEPGVIAGKVMDEGGAGIWYARVWVEGTSMYEGARSDSSGTYYLGRTPPGTYTVFGVAPGFAREDRSGVNVRANDTTIVDFRLKERPTH